ncbi:MAG TPA: MFS transporter [Shinella sp.]|jgi:predicted MFS family arabinose efflux permease|uniref:MFS transporter n=1 Tax=Shinella sp. TaxID=1870904 RepID=UPI002E138ED8|nr:MFS transporter [Shinella sp.]
MTDATIAAPESEAESEADARPAWGAVIAMTLGVFGLVGAEFLPASLLTPMAADLRISEGMAGQAVTATAAVALVTSLLITVVTRKLDRRLVLIGLSVLLIFSNLLVAMSSNLAMLLVGRVLLGMALGGFWTLSAATMMRLVPEAVVPKALSVMFLGVSAATVFAAPVGSYVGDIVGWRNVFLGAAVLGALALVVQLATLPSLPPRGHSRFGTLVEVLARPGVGFAMFAILLVFTGHFAFFTYIRPFLETVTGVGVEGVSAVLLGFGIATFFGNYLGAVLLERSMRLTLTIMPVVMGALALSLSMFGGDLVADAAMVALWGLAFGAVPVAWSTWITRAVPDEAESAGGLFVAAINFAIATGAAAGGALFDANGVSSVFVASGVVLFLAAITIVSAVHTRPA